MNAYELADYLDNNVEAMLYTEQPHLDNASTMLRQQAKRIEELEKELYMIQRHYDQLETFSPSGNNAQNVSNTKEILTKGKE